MIVAGRFKADQDRTSEPAQIAGEVLKVLAPVSQAQPNSSSRSWRFNQHTVIMLGEVYRY
jgi:hypothetical protein